MATVRQGDGAIRANAYRQASDEAPVQIAGQGAVEFAKNLRRGARWEACASEPYNRGDGHGRAKSLAADVAQHNQNLAALARQDTIKISAHLRSWSVGGFDPKAGCGRGSCDQLLLDFTGGFEFDAQGAALVPCLPCPPEEHCGDCHTQQREGQLEEIQREGPAAQGERSSPVHPAR